MSQFPVIINGEVGPQKLNLYELLGKISTA